MYRVVYRVRVYTRMFIPHLFESSPTTKPRGIQLASECGRYWGQAERAPPLGAAIDVGVSLPWKSHLLFPTPSRSLFENFRHEKCFKHRRSDDCNWANVIYAFLFFFSLSLLNRPPSFLINYRGPFVGERMFGGRMLGGGFSLSLRSLSRRSIEIETDDSFGILKCE